MNAWGAAVVNLTFPRNSPQQIDVVGKERDLKERDIVLSRCPNLQTVKVSGRVWSLDDIAEHCPNVKTLHLIQPQDAELDLSPLASCTKLESFTITHDPYAPRVNIQHYHALTSLPRLRKISLKCRVDPAGLEQIKEMTNLEVLDISLSDVELTITPLSTLVNLRKLSCPLVHVQDDVSCWPKLESVTGWTLFSEEGFVDDISFLRTATNVRNLTLPVTVQKETDPTPISACTELTSITMLYLWCDNIDFLGACTKLRKFHVFCGTRELDIAPLANCKELTSCLLEDVSPEFAYPLLQLPNLEVVSFSVGDEGLAESLEELTKCVTLTSIKITVMLPILQKNDLPINIVWMCELPKLKNVELRGRFAIDEYAVERERVREVVEGRGGKVVIDLGTDETGAEMPEWVGDEEEEEEVWTSTDTEEEGSDYEMEE